MSKKTLITASVAEVAALVAVLATYLIAIARVLRSISRTLAQVTMGVRAIEKQTDPLGPALNDVNGALERAIRSLERPPPERRSSP
jgi:ABC-type transporter Mla subunit MlaD